MSYPAPRRPWWIVTKREIMAKLTDKTFWISTILVVVLLVVGFGLSFLFNSGDQTLKVVVVDDAGLQVVELARQDGANISVETVPGDQLAQAVEDGDADVAMSQTSDGWRIVVEGIETDTGALQRAISSWTLSNNALALGVDPGALLKGSTVDVELAGAQVEEDAIVALVAGLVFSVLFFMSALTYGIQIAQSVVEEKESRIVEILAAAIPTRHLLIGKVLGNTIMALGQLLVFISVGVVGILLTPWGDLLPMLVPNIGWFVLFFLVGFAALSCLWAAAGAMATRMQDVNNTSLPLTMILTGVYMAGFFARGVAAQILAYVPIASSVVMPQRLLAGEAGWVNAVIALAVCGLFMMVAIRLGATIYRRGILKTSGILKLREAFSRTG